MTDEKNAQAEAAHDQQQAQRVGESNSTDLLSCPFCGQQPRSGKSTYVDEHKSWLPEFVECPGCKIGFYQKSGAWDRWNNQFTNWVSVTEKLPKEYEPVLIWRKGIPVHHTPLGWVVKGKWSLCDVMRPAVVDKWHELPGPPAR